MIEPVYGNHIGIVINSNPDPEGRGRVQIFVPHLSTTLYQGWNQDAKDITLTQGSLAGINNNVLLRLQQNLPWAECAFPLFGTGGTTYGDASTNETRPSIQSAPVVNGAITGGNTSNEQDRKPPSIETLLPLSSVNYTSTNTSLINSTNLTLNPKLLEAKVVINSTASKANNPGNLHTTSSPLIGQIGSVPDLSKKGNIIVFDSLANGMAADINQIVLYITGESSAADHIPRTTIEDIMPLWTDTQPGSAEARDVISIVSKRSGIDPKTPININDPNQLMNLMGGMAFNESSGIQPNFVENFKLGYETLAQRPGSKIKPGLVSDLATQNNSTILGKPGLLDSTVQPPGVDARHPNGINSVPLAGSFVWCFFLGGDVQKPVYFAGVKEKFSNARTSTVPVKPVLPGSINPSLSAT